VKNELSKKSQEFIDNLQLYLVTSGKKEDDIEDIVQELEDHLMEAEKRGKSVETIVGQSPKAYMEQLSNEMSFDKSWITKYLPMFILGAFAYMVLGDAIRGEMTYSLLQLIGYPLISILFLLAVWLTFKYLASHTPPKWGERLLFGVLAVFPIFAFVGLLFVNRQSDQPVVIEVGQTGTTITISLCILIFIFLSLWGKSWAFIILPLIMFGPELLLDKTSITEETKAIINLPVTTIGFLAYFLISAKRHKKQAL
jgi:hypothetical protein